MPRKPKRWAVFISLAFLLASAGHAHIHLCFDGQEPPADVHALHSDHLGHHPGDREAHDDLDVDLLDDALAKNLKFDLPWMAALAVGFLIIEPPSVSFALPELGDRPIAQPPRFLRPPLRAPPA